MPRHFLLYVGVDGISFSFHDQKEFQIFHCRQKHADLLFYFHSLFQELDENDGYEEICKHTLAILISQLRRFAVSDFQLFPSFHPSKECALVKRYLDSHYSDDINLEQLASLSHLNKYYLSHEFTRYYGISPISYLTHRRIEVCKISWRIQTMKSRISLILPDFPRRVIWLRVSGNTVA